MFTLMPRISFVMLLYHKLIVRTPPYFWDGQEKETFPRPHLSHDFGGKIEIWRIRVRETVEGLSKRRKRGEKLSLIHI